MAEGYPRSLPSGNGYASECTPSAPILLSVIGVGPAGCLGLGATSLTAGPQLALCSDPLVRLGRVLNAVTALSVAFGHSCPHHV